MSRKQLKTNARTVTDKPSVTIDEIANWFNID